MDPKQKYEQMEAWCFAHSIFDAAIEEKIDEWASVAPEATCKEQGATDRIDKAYIGFQIDTGSTSENMQAPTVTTPSNEQIASQATSSLTAEQRQALTDQVLATQKSNKQAAATSQIKQYYVGRPKATDQIPAGTQGTIKQDLFKKIQEKITNKEWKIADDFTDKNGKTVTSQANFDTLKAACEAGTPVAVYRSDSVGAPIGYDVQTPQNPSQAMTREELRFYLTVVCPGFILATNDTPGAKLKTVQRQASRQNINASKKTVTVVQDTNRKEAIEKGLYTPVRELGEPKSSKLKSELSFYVNKYKTEKTIVTKQDANGASYQAEEIKPTSQLEVDKKGNPKKYQVRVTVEASVPTLVPVEEYASKFNVGKEDYTKEPTNPEQIQKLMDARVIALSAMLNDTKLAVTLDPAMMEELNKYKSVVANGNSVPDNAGI